MEQKSKPGSHVPSDTAKAWIRFLEAMKPTEQVARGAQFMQANMTAMAPISSADLHLLFEESGLRCLWARVAEPLKIRITRQLDKIHCKRLHLRRKWVKNPAQ